MAKIIKAPAFIDKSSYRFSVFLAGSIEMGTAEQWQSKIEEGLNSLDIVVLNPRRDDWDSSWVQSIDDDKFRQQVEWELDALSQADIIAMYFDPATKSPITLLEFGLYAKDEKLIVCCPEGYWRKGNVDVVCKRFGILHVNSLGELMIEICVRFMNLKFGNK